MRLRKVKHVDTTEYHELTDDRIKKLIQNQFNPLDLLLVNMMIILWIVAMRLLVSGRVQACLVALCIISCSILFIPYKKKKKREREEWAKRNYTKSYVYVSPYLGVDTFCYNSVYTRGTPRYFMYYQNKSGEEDKNEIDETTYYQLKRCPPKEVYVLVYPLSETEYDTIAFVPEYLNNMSCIEFPRI